MTDDRTEGSPPLQVVHLLSGDLWAGAEVATYHLLLALAERVEIEVSAVLLNRGELAEALIRAGIDVQVWPECGMSFSEILRRFRARATQADLVHAHRYKENLIAALSGAPWLTTQHGMPEPFRGAAALRSSLRRVLDHGVKRFSARRIIAVSEAMEDELRPRYGNKVRCARNGISDPAGISGRLSFAARPRRCGVLARLVPVKGLELAIDALRDVPDLELEIVGDGPLRVELEARADRLGLHDRVIFAGFDPKPLERVRNWRCLLVTSHHEGLPISVLEAMALGTPVLCGNLPGVRETIGEHGVSLDHRDPQGWATALRELVTDVEKGEAHSQGARERFQDHYCADGTAEQVVSIYREVLS